MATVVRRAAARPETNLRTRIGYIYNFALIYMIEGLHPLEGGTFRRKYRRDRRPGLPLANPLAFYPAYALEIAVKFARYFSAFLRAAWLYRTIARDPDRFAYTDLAIAPPETDELETLSLYRDTAGGSEAVTRKQAADRRREKVRTKVA
jgi:hypothetical protein